MVDSWYASRGNVLTLIVVVFSLGFFLFSGYIYSSCSSSTCQPNVVGLAVGGEGKGVHIAYSTTSAYGTTTSTSSTSTSSTSTSSTSSSSTSSSTSTIDFNENEWIYGIIGARYYCPEANINFTTSLTDNTIVSSYSWTNLERGLNTKAIYLHNFDTVTANDVKVVIKELSVGAPISVVGDGSVDQPIQNFAAGTSVQLFVNLNLEDVDADSMTFKMGVASCAAKDLVTSPQVSVSMPSRAAPAYDINITPSTLWNITVSNSSNKDTTCSDIKRAFTIINNGSKKISRLIVTAVGTCSDRIIFNPGAGRFDNLKPGESVSFTAYFMATNTTGNCNTTIKVSYVGTLSKNITVIYNAPGGSWRYNSTCLANTSSVTATGFICENHQYDSKTLKLPPNFDSSKYVAAGASIDFTCPTSCSSSQEHDSYVKVNSVQVGSLLKQAPCGKYNWSMSPSRLQAGDNVFELITNNYLAGGHYCTTTAYTLLWSRDSNGTCESYLDTQECLFCRPTVTNENTYALCHDGVDNDCDALTDCWDSGCCDSYTNTSGCVGVNRFVCNMPENFTVATCTNSIDDDLNGLMDCNDTAVCCQYGSCSSTRPCQDYTGYNAFDYTNTTTFAGANGDFLLNETIAGVELKFKYKKDDSGNLVLDRERYRRKNLKATYQIIVFDGNISNTTALIAYDYNFTKKQGFNMSKIRVEGRADRNAGNKRFFVCAKGVNTTTGSLTQFYVGRWPYKNCTNIYECDANTLGCSSGGTQVPTGRITEDTVDNVCIVNNTPIDDSKTYGKCVENRNTLPTITAFNITPLNATPGSNFTFAIKVVDADNDTPKSGYPKISVDGNQYNMTKATQGTDYATGIWFNYTINLSKGSHNFSFIFDDNAAGNATLGTGGRIDSATLNLTMYVVVDPQINLTANRWNFISLSKELDNMSVQSVLRSVYSNFTDLTYWDPTKGTSGGYRTYTPNCPSCSDFTTMDSAKAYWIWPTGNVTLTFYGNETTSKSITIATSKCTSNGLNACYIPFGFVSLNGDSMNVNNTIFSDCGNPNGNYSRVMTYNASSQSWMYYGLSTQTFNKLFTGYGFYLQINASKTICKDNVLDYYTL